jgi:transposase
VLEETGYTVELKGLVCMYKGASNENDTETIVFVFRGELREKKTEELEEDIIEAEFKHKEEIEGLNLREEKQERNNEPVQGRRDLSPGHTLAGVKPSKA